MPNLSETHPKALLTMRECSAELRVSKQTVLKLVNGDPAKGKGPVIPSLRIGRRVFVRAETLQRFMSNESLGKLKSAA